MKDQEANINKSAAPIPFPTAPSSNRSPIRKRFFRNKRGVIALCILILLLFLFVFADLLANNKPIVAKYDGKLRSPVFNEYLIKLHIKKGTAQDHQNWHHIDYDFVIWPVIPYGPKQQDVENISVSPAEEQQVRSLRWRHWLGTDELGRDLLSAMIHATRIDLSVGIVAMGVAAFLGIFFGAFAGFFADDRVKVSVSGIIFNLIFIFLGFFYAFFIRSAIISEALGSGLLPFISEVVISSVIFSLFIVIGNLIAIPFSKLPLLQKKLYLPFDSLISRLIEIVVSVPVIFLIIMILAVTGKGSIFWVMVVIGLTRWTGIARLIRAELLKIRQLEYIEAARALGLRQYKILLHHAIPNAMGPVFIAIAFGIAGAILIEAFLSFIGIGIPPDEQTWGSLLSQGRDTPRDWWMALFPGLAIFITVTVFNLLGEALSDAMDPKQH